MEKMLNMQEYADEIGVCRSTVVGWIYDERIPFKQVGNAIRIKSGTKRPEKRPPWYNKRMERISLSK